MRRIIFHSNILGLLLLQFYNSLQTQSPSVSLLQLLFCNNEHQQWNDTIVFLLLLCVRQLAAEIWFIGRIAVQLYMCTVYSVLYSCRVKTIWRARIRLVRGRVCALESVTAGWCHHHHSQCSVRCGAGQWWSGSDWRAELWLTVPPLVATTTTTTTMRKLVSLWGLVRGNKTMMMWMWGPWWQREIARIVAYFQRAN